jgi:hypothetical protein
MPDALGKLVQRLLVFNDERAMRLGHDPSAFLFPPVQQNRDAMNQSERL